MPEPHEEINNLNKNSPEKLRTEELRGRWLEDNPGQTDSDYNKFKATLEGRLFSQNYTEQWRQSEKRWDSDKTNLPNLASTDQKIFGQGQDAFGDPQAKGVYVKLLDTFEDQNFNPMSRTWDIPKDAQGEWQQLLDSTKRRVQRNATDLASVVAGVKQPAIAAEYGNAFEKARADDPNKGATAQKAADQLKNSALYKTLDAVERALSGWELAAKNWDASLDPKSSPDKKPLMDAANECYDRFFEFYREHVGGGYWNDGTAPFVRYQLVATMKLLAEKVASQFQSRVGKPSFSAMYEFISDVPKSVREDVAKGKAGDFVANATEAKSRSKAWDVALRSIANDVRKAEPGKVDHLKTFFDGQMLKPALDRWYNNYDSLANAKKRALALKEMHTDAGTIAFSLRQAKDFVEGALNDDTKPGVPALRQRYHQLFEGLAVLHQQDILFCQKFFQ